MFSSGSGDSSDESGSAGASSSSGSADAPAAPQPVVARRKPKPRPKPVNLNDASALDSKYDIDATTACGNDADEFLRKTATYDFKWDEMGFLDTKFDKYLTHVSARGVLTLASDKISLQNGFGAYQRVELLCYYDTQKQEVLRYEVIEPGQ